MANTDSDIKKIEKLISLMKNNDLVEVEIAHGDDKISLKRHDPQAAAFTAASMFNNVPMAMPPSTGLTGDAGTAESTKADDLHVITSPIVGTFYEAPSPNSGPFVESGTHIGPQTVVCIIEAMKVMNEIKADVSGTIVSVLVENGAALEYGQPLFKVQPDV
ncbi:acetyl-CoA carboxylase biotin carboxyl carrier protein [Planctomycetota bacterium]